jgi:hypothetical protein
MNTSPPDEERSRVCFFAGRPSGRSRSGTAGGALAELELTPGMVRIGEGDKEGLIV